MSSNLLYSVLSGITYGQSGIVSAIQKIKSKIDDYPSITSSFNNTFLGNDGKFHSLPSYVDDVIEGYYYEDSFYEESNHLTKINGESGKLYVDITNLKNDVYRWSGSTYVKISANSSNDSNVIVDIDELSGKVDELSGKVDELLSSSDEPLNSSIQYLIFNIPNIELNEQLSLHIDFSNNDEFSNIVQISSHDSHYSEYFSLVNSETNVFNGSPSGQAFGNIDSNKELRFNLSSLTLIEEIKEEYSSYNRFRWCWYEHNSKISGDFNFGMINGNHQINNKKDIENIYEKIEYISGSVDTLENSHNIDIERLEGEIDDLSGRFDNFSPNTISNEFLLFRIPQIPESDLYNLIITLSDTDDFVNTQVFTISENTSNFKIGSGDGYIESPTNISYIYSNETLRFSLSNVNSRIQSFKMAVG